MRFVCLLALALTACPPKSRPPPEPDEHVTIDERKDAEMRTWLTNLLHLSPEVAGRLRRVTTRARCGEYVDDVQKLGFIVAITKTGYLLDAAGSPPKPTMRCKTPDEFAEDL